MARSRLAAVGAGHLPDVSHRLQARDAVDRVRSLAPCVQLCVDAALVRPSTASGLAAIQSAGLRRRVSTFGVQHRLVVRHQHELAGVFRRVHDELSHADGRPRVSQFRLCCGRHRVGGRLHPRHCKARAGHHRQFLGGHDQVSALDSIARVRRRRPCLRVAGGGAEPQALRCCPDSRGPRHTDDRAGPGRLAGGDQAVRHQRRWVLQREQRAPVRESDTGHELPGDVPHLPHSRGADLDAGRHDRLTPARLGGLGGDGRSCLQSA